MTEKAEIRERAEVTEGAEMRERAEVTEKATKRMEMTEKAEATEGAEMRERAEVTEGAEVRERAEVTEKATKRMEMRERAEVTEEKEMKNGDIRERRDEVCGNRDVEALIALLDGAVTAGESRMKLNVVEGDGEVVAREYHHGRCDVGSPWACGTAFDVLE